MSAAEKRIIPYAKPEASPAPEGGPDQFPIHAFPPALRQVAENMQAVYQTPVCLPAMSALAVLSGAVGASVVVRGGFKDKTTRLNLYVIAVAERGSGKGVIGESLCKPIAERSSELTEAHRRKVASMRGELGVLKKQMDTTQRSAANAKGPERENQLATINDLSEKIDSLERDATREKTLLVGDTTSEALARVLEDNAEVMFSYSSEAGGAVKVALGKYTNSGDIDLLLSGYSGDSVRASRITRKSVELKNPCLCLLWLVQNCVMRQLTGDPEAFSRGLTARPLIFDTGSKREMDDRKDLSFEYAEAWRSLILAALDRREAGAYPLEITCTPEAREVFAKFHDESVRLERGPYADLAGELSRWRENAIKVAGLIAVAEDSSTVTADIAARAVSIVRWAGFNYLGLLQAGRRERQRQELERLLDLINSAGGSINLGPLNTNHGWGPDRLAAVMAANPGQLEIYTPPSKGAGRPGQMLRRASKSSLSTKSSTQANKLDLIDLMEGGATP